MSFKDEKSLLNLLVDETFSDDFESDLGTYKLSYIEPIKSFQTVIQGRAFTFPINWGPFQSLHENKEQNIILEKDSELLNEIFSQFLDKDIKVAFCFNKFEVSMLFIKKGLKIGPHDLQMLVEYPSEFKLSA